MALRAPTCASPRRPPPLKTSVVLPNFGTSGCAVWREERGKAPARGKYSNSGGRKSIPNWFLAFMGLGGWLDGAIESIVINAGAMPRPRKGFGVNGFRAAIHVSGVSGQRIAVRRNERFTAPSPIRAGLPSRGISGILNARINSQVSQFFAERTFGPVPGASNRLPAGATTEVKPLFQEVFQWLS